MMKNFLAPRLKIDHKALHLLENIFSVYKLPSTPEFIWKAKKKKNGSKMKWENESDFCEWHYWCHVRIRNANKRFVSKYNSIKLIAHYGCQRKMRQLFTCKTNNEIYTQYWILTHFSCLGFSIRFLPPINCVLCISGVCVYAIFHNKMAWRYVIAQNRISFNWCAYTTDAFMIEL